MFNQNINLENRLLRIFNIVPEKSKNRNKNKSVQKLFTEYNNYLNKHEEEIIDLMTDGVKDLLTPDDLKNIKTKFNNIFENNIDPNLKNKIKNIDSILTIEERNNILVNNLKNLENEISNLKNQIVSADWSESIEIANQYTILSEILNLSLRLIDLTLNYLNKSNNNTNIFLGMAIFLIIKFIAMTQKKVTEDSLVYSLTAIQIELYNYGASPFY